MKIHCRFTFKYPESVIAQRIKEALEVDNYKFIQTELENTTLFADTDSESLMSLLHTIEDYLSCLGTAENVIEQTEGQLKKD
jgi:hypothetical protein